MNLETGLPAVTPPPPSLSNMNLEDSEPLLSASSSTQLSCERNVDLESGSRQRAKAMALMAMIIVLVAGVVRRYPYVSGSFLIAILLLLIFYSVLAAFGLFIGSLVAVIYNLADQAVYCPDFPPEARSSVQLPSAFGLPSENLRLYASDGTRLHAVFVGQADSIVRRNAATVLFLHGNAGNMGHRLINLVGLYSRLACNILMLEYRGYGYSSGVPSEKGLYEDAIAALSYLHTRQDIDTTKIILFGRSLGGAVAVELASRAEARHQIKALIVENTFTSIPDMAKILLGQKIKFIEKIPLFFYKNKFLSRLKMLRVQVPTLVISGSKDNLVPPHMASQLYQACGARMKRLLKFASGSHNETWRCSGYYISLKYFLEELFKGVPLKDSPPHVMGVSYIMDSSRIL